MKSPGDKMNANHTWVERARDLAKTPDLTSPHRERKKADALFAKLKNQIGLCGLRLRRLKFVHEQFLLSRRLATSVRKRITSHYTQTEREEIASAAGTLGVSPTKFVFCFIRAKRNPHDQFSSWVRTLFCLILPRPSIAGCYSVDEWQKQLGGRHDLGAGKRVKLTGKKIKQEFGKFAVGLEKPDSGQRPVQQVRGSWQSYWPRAKTCAMATVSELVKSAKPATLLCLLKIVCCEKH